MASKLTPAEIQSFEQFDRTNRPLLLDLATRQDEWGDKTRQWLKEFRRMVYVYSRERGWGVEPSPVQTVNRPGPEDRVDKTYSAMIVAQVLADEARERSAVTGLSTGRPGASSTHVVITLPSGKTVKVPRELVPTVKARLKAMLDENDRETRAWIRDRDGDRDNG